MCGIAAIYHPNGRISSEALERATARLYHRGPDGQRQWVAAHGQVGLGHARLSIIDLVTGDQPIGNEDGRRHIVVNGEFSDFERIRSELEGDGHRFRTHSDSEIALHLYEDLGPQCLHQLRGEYAFVLWDEAQQRLLPRATGSGSSRCSSAARRRALPRLRDKPVRGGVPARWSGKPTTPA